ncbi:MAG: branched-chain amino acid transporter substrate-binding protein [Symbiobacteriaceae bacterium]|nr:branched-chain amino acid transporter substrate-binding protein [Symbiobacteriaceae bacterium]
MAVWLLLTVLLLVFSVGSLGGFRYRAGRWPVLPAAVTGTDPSLPGKSLPNLSQENPQETAGYLRSVVAISTTDQKMGSGFIIDEKGHVVTAQHVVDGVGCVTVTDDDGHQHQGTVLNYDMALDIALLHVKTLEKWPDRLEMSTEKTPARVGDETYVIGHPRSTGNNTRLSATVTKLDDPQRAEGRYHEGLVKFGGVTVVNGTSGGPLVKQSTGQVIGVTILSGAPAEVGWARPTADIVNMVREWSALTPTAGCQPTTAIQPISLTLVTVTPRTGNYDVEGEELADGVEMALRDNREALLSVGYDVSIKRLDDAGSPTLARDRVTMAVQDPEVIGVVGSLENQTTRAIAEALSLTGVPLVAPTAGADDLADRGFSHFNRVVANSGRQNPALANFAKGQLRVGNVFILEDGSPDAAVQVKAFTEGAAVIGLPLSGSLKVSAAFDAAELKKHLADARAEAVYYAGSSQLAVDLIRSLRSLEVMLPFLGTQEAFAPTQFLPYVDADAQGVYFTRLTAEQVDQFKRKYEQVFGKASRGYAGYGYDAAYAIIAALRKYGAEHPAQRPARADLARLIRETRGLPGWSALITFESNGENQTSWVHVYEWRMGRPVHTRKQ